MHDEQESAIIHVLQGEHDDVIATSRSENSRSTWMVPRVTAPRWWCGSS